MPTETLTITDDRTGRVYKVPIADGAIRAADLRQIKVADEDFGLMSYDPAFLNTASARARSRTSTATRGSSATAATPSSSWPRRLRFLEVAWLLRTASCPTRAEYDEWVHDITYHTYVHENIRKFLEGFRYDAHPMAMLISAVAALSTFYPEAHATFDDPDVRNISIMRLLAKVPTIAAFCYRHRGPAVRLPRQRPRLTSRTSSRWSRG